MLHGTTNTWWSSPPCWLSPRASWSCSPPAKQLHTHHLLWLLHLLLHERGVRPVRSHGAFYLLSCQNEANNGFHQRTGHPSTGPESSLVLHDTACWRVIGYGVFKLYEKNNHWRRYLDYYAWKRQLIYPYNYWMSENNLRIKYRSYYQWK